MGARHAVGVVHIFTQQIRHRAADKGSPDVEVYLDGRVGHILVQRPAACDEIAVDQIDVTDRIAAPCIPTPRRKGKRIGRALQLRVNPAGAVDRVRDQRVVDPIPVVRGDGPGKAVLAGHAVGGVHVLAQHVRRCGARKGPVDIEVYVERLGRHVLVQRPALDRHVGVDQVDVSDGLGGGLGVGC